MIGPDDLWWVLLIKSGVLIVFLLTGEGAFARHLKPSRSDGQTICVRDVQPERRIAKPLRVHFVPGYVAVIPDRGVDRDVVGEPKRVVDAAHDDVLWHRSGRQVVCEIKGHQRLRIVGVEAGHA